ncbi:MAG: hypothetical protein AAF824_02335 [Bacteroidota bacterium]
MLFSQVLAQTELGVRFASNFNYFPDAQSLGLAEDFFSTGVLGFFVARYKSDSRIEAGINIIHKSADDSGLFPNLPLVMQDFNDAQSVGLTAVEAHFRAGPSIGIFNPKIGYVLGYRLQADNFQTTGQGEITRTYFALPFGFSFDLPTSFGSVGVGASYYLGISNVIKGSGNRNGQGRIRALNIELTVAYDPKGSRIR